jgi:hypothetical protein
LGNKKNGNFSCPELPFLEVKCSKTEQKNGLSGLFLQATVFFLKLPVRPPNSIFRSGS